MSFFTLFGNGLVCFKRDKKEKNNLKKRVGDETEQLSTSTARKRMRTEAVKYGRCLGIGNKVIDLVASETENPIISEKRVAHII